MRHQDSATLRYITSTFAEESAWLHAARLKGEALAEGMQVSPAEGKLLQVLAHMVQAKHILEIGSFVGYSTLWMAAALPDDGQITSIEISAEHAAHARAHIAASPYAERCYIMEGKALDVVQELATRQPMPLYDMIFIDAAKSEYAQLLALCEPMLRVGGLMIGDNTLLFGNLTGEPQKKVSAAAIHSMRQFNQLLAEGAHYASVMIPTEEGLTIGVKLP